MVPRHQCGRRLTITCTSNMSGRCGPKDDPCLRNVLVGILCNQGLLDSSGAVAYPRSVSCLVQPEAGLSRGEVLAPVSHEDEADGRLTSEYLFDHGRQVGGERHDQCDKP